MFPESIRVPEWFLADVGLKEDHLGLRRFELLKVSHFNPESLIE